MSNESAPHKKAGEEEQSEPVKKPFDLDEALRTENIEASEEDAAAEQQRKEAMTERD
jgi:hypothetical protein